MQRTHGRSFGLVVMALLVTNAALASIPAHATDAYDTLHIVFSTAETGFDPQALSDNYSWTVANSIFDAPYKYDYFARPLRIVPNTASAMPEITEGGAPTPYASAPASTSPTTRSSRASGVS